MDESVIKSLAEEVAKRIRIPQHLTYLGKAEIATCLGVSKTAVTNIVQLPDFPPCYMFPNGLGGFMHKKWLAQDVEKWAMSYRSREAKL